MRSEQGQKVGTLCSMTQTHRVAGTEQDVVGLQVTVQDLVLVQQLHAICNIQRSQQRT